MSALSEEIYTEDDLIGLADKIVECTETEDIIIAFAEQTYDWLKDLSKSELDDLCDQFNYIKEKDL